MDRVLIKPEKIQTQGLIEVPELFLDKRYDAQTIGTLIAVGPDCYIHYVQKLSDGTTVTSGYSGPAAVVGQRVVFAKWGGISVKGKDGEEYRIMRDEDITCIVDPEVDLSDLVIDERKPMGKR